VASIPEATYFKPAGIPLRALEDVGLAVEEVEALRLKDLAGLQQVECAKRMRISRPTFHRILRSAHRKIADAFVNGKAIRVEGGNFALPRESFRCRRDGHEWQVPFEAVASGLPLACPRCDSPGVRPIRPRSPALRGPGRRRGRR
jgi:predicted DNA-binding protein (UPF0251 family)